METTSQMRGQIPDDDPWFGSPDRSILDENPHFEDKTGRIDRIRARLGAPGAGGLPVSLAQGVVAVEERREPVEHGLLFDAVEVALSEA